MSCTRYLVLTSESCRHGLLYQMHSHKLKSKHFSFKWFPPDSYKLSQSVYSSIQSSGEDSKHWHTLFGVNVDPRRCKPFFGRPKPANILQLAALTAIQFVKSALSSRRYESSWTLDWASQLEFSPFCHSFFPPGGNKPSPAHRRGLQVETAPLNALIEPLWRCI